MSTHSRHGDNQKLAADILFAEVTRYKTLRRGLCNLLTCDPMRVVRSRKQKEQSSAKAPVVLIKDLSKSHGDWVSVDLLHEPIEAPVMGDNFIEGKEEPLTRSTFELQIDQYRKSVSQGGKMTQQRRGYDLIKAGKAALRDYWPRLKSEIMLYHLAGARGYYYDVDMILPLDTPTSNLPEYLINPMEPPTFNRQFYGGNANSVDGTTGNPITPGDIFDRPTLDNLSTAMQEMAHPPQAIDLSTEDKPMETDPFYLLLVTPRQWQTFKQSSQSFDMLVANATRRAAGFNHHLFKGDCFMLDNILVRKYHMPIRFPERTTVMVSNDDDNATVHAEIVPQGVTMDRALLLGAQAAAMAVGKTVPGITFRMVNERFDMKNKHRSGLEWMAGLRKIRFRDRFGRMEDYGVIALDTAVQA